jgi:hypothetical protein
LLDFNEFIQRELRPEIIDTILLPGLDAFIRWFGIEDPQSGDRITSRYRLGYSSNAGYYTKSDVDVASGSQTLKKPYWDKVFAQGAAEVHNIDISNDRGDQGLNQFGDAVKLEMEYVMNVLLGGFYTQMKKDIDSSSVAYSDASLSRSTYPLLVSYEEATNTPITLALVRAMIKALTLGKGTKIQDYLCMMEGEVYYKFQPLAAAMHTWNITGVAGKEEDMGWQPVGNFEGLKITQPDEFPEMTTGDVITVRPKDVRIQNHRVLDIVPKTVGRDAVYAAIYTGWNVRVENPYLNGKMTDKD